MDSERSRRENTTSQHLILSSPRISRARDQVRLESNLDAIAGVWDVEVDPARHTVDIEYDPTTVDELRLRGAIEDAGYRLDERTSRAEADRYLEDELTQADQEGGSAEAHPPGNATFNPDELFGATRVFEE